MTVTTEAYVPGCFVMLKSFLQHHDDWNEPVIVVHDGLTDASQQRLLALSPLIELVTPGADIAVRVDRLAEAIPQMSATLARFLSLEGLRPRRAGRVLLIDADTLFLAPLGAFLGPVEGVRAVGDGCMLRGRARSLDDFTETNPAPGTLYPTFNAGLVLLAGESINQANFASLLDLLDPALFQRSRCGLHDQLLLNLRFADRVELASWRYNLLLRHHALILRKEVLAPDAIVMVHFNTREKPWHFDPNSEMNRRDPLWNWAVKKWREYR